MRRRTAVAVGLSIVVFGLAALLFADQRSRVREVIASELYRSGQLDSDALRTAVHEHGLRSILNLRGAAPGSSWYEAERLEAGALGVRHVDLRMSADRLPSRTELSQLVALLEDLERPLLFHCLGGQDRSGLAEAMIVLLAGGSVEDARESMRLSIGGLAAVGVGYSPLVEYVDQYANWLDTTGFTHTSTRAREYALLHYVPALYAAEVRLLSFPDGFVAGGRYSALFRIENRSPRRWRLTEGRSDVGVHLGLRIERLGAPMPPCEARAFTSGGTLDPGQALDLTMNLPVLDTPGTYRLRFDMVNESEAWFADRNGSEPLVREIRVRERRPDEPARKSGGAGESGDDFVWCDDP